jgi:hypothetical protein
VDPVPSVRESPNATTLPAAPGRSTSTPVTETRYQAMNATVSGKANERWERRSSPNSALAWTSADGIPPAVVMGEGASVVTGSPRAADA